LATKASIALAGTASPRMSKSGSSGRRDMWSSHACTCARSRVGGSAARSCIDSSTRISRAFCASIAARLITTESAPCNRAIQNSGDR